MVPMQRLALKHHHRNDCEHRKRDYFLNDFQLKESEWTSISDKTNAIAWHLQAVFEEC